MAHPTSIKNGDSVSVGATETEYELSGLKDFPLTLVRLELVSGTIQSGTATKADTFVPSLTTEASYSTAGDKWALTVQNGVVNLRMKGTGVVKVTW
jgi:hypothetical protein